MDQEQKWKGKRKILGLYQLHTLSLFLFSYIHYIYVYMYICIYVYVYMYICIYIYIFSYKSNHALYQHHSINEDRYVDWYLPSLKVWTKLTDRQRKREQKTR